MIKTISSFFAGVRKRVNNIAPLTLAVVLFLIFLLPLATYNRTTAGGDMAEYINNPLRVINGELPYRDFWLLFPPGEVILPALIYKIFGLNINILLIFSVVISALIGLFSFLLGKAIFKDNFFATISAILVFFNGVTAHYLGYAYIHMYFLMLLISGFFFIKYLRDSGAANLFLTGIFVGLAFLFKLYTVGAGFLALFLTIFIHSSFDRKPISYSIKSCVIFCSGVFLVISITSLALIEIWQPMVREIVIESVSHGTSMNLPYFISSIPHLERLLTNLKLTWNGDIFYVGKIPNYLTKFIITTLLYLLPFIIVGISIWNLFGNRLEKNDKVIALFFLLWGMFTFPQALGRSDMPHLALSITPLFFLLIFLLQRSIENFKENKSFFRKFITYGLAIITLLLVIQAQQFIVSTGSKLMKPYYKVTTKHGTLLFKNESEARDVNAVINFINENTKEGDYIFVTPWFAPPFYALTNRKNPTYYDSLIDLVARPSEGKQKKVCYDLLNNNVKLIIHYPYWGFDNKEELQFLNTCPILQRCIEDNFELVEKYGRYWIYKKKSQTPN